MEKIVKALNISLEAITELESGASINIVANIFDNSSVVLNWQPTFKPIYKIIELYDKLLETKKEKIKLLENILREKK